MHKHKIVCTSDVPITEHLEEIYSIVKNNFEFEKEIINNTCVLHIDGDNMDTMIQVIMNINEIPGISAKRLNEDILYEENKDTKEIKDKIDHMIGCESFKQLIDEIDLISKFTLKDATYPIFFSQTYLLSIAEGCGQGRILSYMKEYLYKAKLIDDYKIVEKKIGSYDDLENERFLKELSVSENKFYLFDISMIMDNLDTTTFRDFLQVLRKHLNKNIYIFRIPYVEIKRLDIIYAHIDNILNVKNIVIPPLKNYEILEYAYKFLDQFHYRAGMNFDENFLKLITLEKNDGKFYGIETVEKVVHKIIYNKQLKNAKNGTTSHRIKGDEIYHEDTNQYLSANEQLEQLVGLTEAKKQIKEMVGQIKAEKNSSHPIHATYHMCFYGNPGTGKTTVARIVAAMLKEAGVLENGVMQEHFGRELVGIHVGETAPKTAAICQECYGSILFIDEAYTLASNKESNDFGREALDTLVSEMENNRDNLIVILAGYQDRMEETLKSNPGLAGRIPFKIYFENYNREELFEIFMSMVQDNFTYDQEFELAAKKYFDSIPDSFIQDEDFSNARFVRNLYERTYGKALLRLNYNPDEKVQLLSGDLISACNHEDFKALNEMRE